MDLSSPPYRMETARLSLRPWAAGDAPLWCAAVGASAGHLRDGFVPFMEGEPRDEGQAVSLLRGYRAAFERDELHRFAVFERESGEMVGETMLIARVGPEALELGYWTHADHCRKGFAVEAGAAMLWLAFRIHRGVDRVEVQHVTPDNDKSGAVAARLGFKREATLRRRISLPGGRRADCALWSVFAHEYEARGAPPTAFNALGADMVA